MKNNILDIYIIKKFLVALFLSLAGFVFIYVITNLFENIGYFVDRKASPFTVLKYYMLFSPKIILLLTPLATLMGIYFSLGLITKHNEALALRGLGVSPVRIYRPIFVYVFLVSPRVFSFTHSLIPRSRELLKEFKSKQIDKLQEFKKSYARNINYITEKGEIVNIKRLSDSTIYEIHILIYRDGKMTSRIDAERGEWEDSCWTLYEVYVRNFVNDRVFLEFKSKETIKDLKISPDELTKSKYDPLNLSFLALWKYIRRLERSGQKSSPERIELFERITFPFVSAILLLFGCPLALEVKRRGFLFGFGLGTLSAFTFWGIIQFFKELGINGNLPPSLSILIPDILFLSIGLYFTVKKEYL
jgi:lipopolysaccharide export system permease protein